MFGMSPGSNGKRTLIRCVYPDHEDRHPSMALYEHHAFCYGCHRSADTIKLTQIAHDECSFGEACSILCKEAGVEPPKWSAEAAELHSKREALSEILESVMSLARTNREKAVEYLAAERNISREFLETLDVGYFPTMTGTLSQEDLDRFRRAGLVADARFLFDGCLILPLRVGGEVQGFYGRSLDQTADKQYRHKKCAATDPPMRPTLYGFDEHRGECEAWLTESPIDALSLQAHGIPAMSCGTAALTREQAKLLKKSKAERFVVCFDNDENAAGQKGAHDVGLMLFRGGRDVYVISLPRPSDAAKMDVNDYLRTHTIEELQSLPRADLIDSYLAAGKKDHFRARNKRLKTLCEAVAVQDEGLHGIFAHKIHKAVTEITPQDEPKPRVEDVRKGVQKAAKKAEESQGPPKFLPLTEAKKITKSSHYLSTNSQVYEYREGVYVPLRTPEAENVVTASLQETLGDEVRYWQVTEVSKFLFNSVDVPPQKLNPKGLICLANGVLNIETLEEPEPHSPNHKFTVKVDVPYDPSAKAPLWEAFLEQIQPDPLMRKLLCQIAGYTLDPNLDHEVAFLLHGRGRNGKGTFCKVWCHVLGEQNFSTVSLSDLSTRFRVAELENRLLNYVDDTSAKGRFDDEMFKKVTSGAVINAERKNQPIFKLKSFAKWIICCNEKPKSRDKTFAMLERLRFVPFETTIPREDRDEHLQEKLKAEAPGILRWGLAGLLSLRQEGGFVNPPQCQESHDEYRRDLDPKTEFLEENVTLEKGAKGDFLSDIYAAYQSWCPTKGRHAENEKALAEALKELIGHKGEFPRSTGGKRRVPRVTLKTAGTEDTTEDRRWGYGQ